MTSQLQINHMIRELRVHRRTLVTLHGWKVVIEYSLQGGLLISTPIYQGDHYIPLGVREALHTNPLERSSLLRTHVTLNESAYMVTLHHTGREEDLSPGFSEILEEFCWAAERWWLYLDERDRRDLVHIHVK
jgi:hypothetical protein